jgi:hypothetical protein
VVHRIGQTLQRLIGALFVLLAVVISSKAAPGSPEAVGHAPYRRKRLANALLSSLP